MGAAGRPNRKTGWRATDDAIIPARRRRQSLPLSVRLSVCRPRRAHQRRRLRQAGCCVRQAYALNDDNKMPAQQRSMCQAWEDARAHYPKEMSPRAFLTLKQGLNTTIIYRAKCFCISSNIDEAFKFGCEKPGASASKIPIIHLSAPLHLNAIFFCISN